MNTLLMICCAVIAGLAFVGYIKGFTKIILPLIAIAIPLIFLYILNNWLLGFLLSWVFSGEAYIFARIIVVGLSLVLCKLVFRIVIQVLKLIPHLPLVRGVDKILGLLTGAIEGLLLIWIFLYLVNINRGMLFGIEWSGLIEGNPFMVFLYQNNLIEHLMTTVFSGWFV